MRLKYDKYYPTRHTIATEKPHSVPHKEETKEIKEIEGWSEFHAAYPCGTKDDGTKRRWPKTGRNSASNAFGRQLRRYLPSQLIEAAKNYASLVTVTYNPKRFLKESIGDYQKAPKQNDFSIFNKDWDSM